MSEHATFEQGFVAGKEDRALGRTMTGWPPDVTDDFRRGWGEGYDYEVAWPYSCAECGTKDADTYVVTGQGREERTEVCRECDDKIRHPVGQAIVSVEIKHLAGRDTFKDIVTWERTIYTLTDGTTLPHDSWDGEVYDMFEYDDEDEDGRPIPPGGRFPWEA